MNAKVMDRLATLCFILCAAITAGTLFSLLGYIVFQGVSHIDWHFLTADASTFQAGGGIKNQLWNSFYMLLMTMLFSVPLGIAGGIYLAEYARPNKITAFLRSCVEVLASLPSIIVGMFGMLLFVNTFHWGYSVLSGALALTIFNLPVIIRVTEDALTAVAREQKEASFALGATHWQTIRTVLLPAAFPGLLTGIILSVGRVFGESAALLFTAGLSTPNLNFGDWNPMSPQSPINPFRSAETLSVHIWAVNTNGIIPDAKIVAAGSSAVLVIVVLLFNIIARLVGALIEKRWSGK